MMNLSTSSGKFAKNTWLSLAGAHSGSALPDTTVLPLPLLRGLVLPLPVATPEWTNLSHWLACSSNFRCCGCCGDCGDLLLLPFLLLAGLLSLPLPLT